ncbi:MAG: ribonuclease HII [Spirochaetaceae bacterium]|jgi:ribonuclease HII|nr:ribonuclease HII [Spirochaetaceae bacterium]
MEDKAKRDKVCGADCHAVCDTECGIDEAGRGPLAGPVCAAAVVLPSSFPREILGDSKKLSEKKRDAAAAIIKLKARAYGIGWATHEEIDALNILKASLLAMRRAFIALSINGALPPGETLNLTRIIIDGLYAPDLQDTAPSGCAIIPLVKADAKIPAVMAASILAKTERDAEMRRLAALYPAYRYDKHKGYPTQEHAALIRQHGPSPIQRRSFTVPDW